MFLVYFYFFFLFPACPCAPTSPSTLSLSIFLSEIFTPPWPRSKSFNPPTPNHPSQIILTVNQPICSALFFAVRLLDHKDQVHGGGGTAKVARRRVHARESTGCRHLHDFVKGDAVTVSSVSESHVRMRCF